MKRISVVFGCAYLVIGCCIANAQLAIPPSPAGKLDSAFQIIQQSVADGSIPGASVLIMQDGQVIESRAFGVCEIDPNRPFETDTICWIASLTKPVTTTAALKLVERGKLQLDESIATYLPQFVHLATTDNRRQTVTIRQLMSHSSGIPASVPLREPFFFNQAWYDHSLSDVVDAIAKRPLDFAPGSNVHYSNAAPYVLGRIIEVVSEKTYGDFVRSEILQPLQMRDTGFSIPRNQIHRAAVVYRREKQELKVYCRYDPDWQVTMTMPDGGLFSTPFDIASFANSFLDSEHSLLDAKLTDEMMTPQSSGYGLGWILDKPHQFSHWGSSGTLVWGDRRTGVVGVFFSQIQDFDLLANLRERFRTSVDEAFRTPSPALDSVP